MCSERVGRVPDDTHLRTAPSQQAPRCTGLLAEGVLGHRS